MINSTFWQSFKDSFAFPQFSGMGTVFSAIGLWIAGDPYVKKIPQSKNKWTKILQGFKAGIKTLCRILSPGHVGGCHYCISFILRHTFFFFILKSTFEIHLWWKLVASCISCHVAVLAQLSFPKCVWIWS